MLKSLYNFYIITSLFGYNYNFSDVENHALNRILDNHTFINYPNVSHHTNHLQIIKNTYDKLNFKINSFTLNDYWLEYFPKHGNYCGNHVLNNSRIPTDGLDKYCQIYQACTDNSNNCYCSRQLYYFVSNYNISNKIKDDILYFLNTVNENCPNYNYDYNYIYKIGANKSFPLYDNYNINTDSRLTLHINKKILNINNYSLYLNKYSKYTLKNNKNNTQMVRLVPLTNYSDHQIIIKPLPTVNIVILCTCLILLLILFGYLNGRDIK
jgi:hypothetical protein